MTQEEKDLVVKDLCTRLPYGLYATVRDPEENDDFQPFEVLGIKEDLVWVRNTMIGVDHFDTIEVVKPYLRPMSSMTEEELNECVEQSGIGDVVCPNWHSLPKEKHFEARLNHSINMFLVDSRTIDWLNAHHFDYRHLIGKGLALEAPKGMYNT